jgi:hypothetical protein
MTYQSHHRRLLNPNDSTQPILISVRPLRANLRPRNQRPQLPRRRIPRNNSHTGARLPTYSKESASFINAKAPGTEGMSTSSFNPSNHPRRRINRIRRQRVSLISKQLVAAVSCVEVVANDTELRSFRWEDGALVRCRSWGCFSRSKSANRLRLVETQTSTTVCNRPA